MDDTLHQPPCGEQFSNGGNTQPSVKDADCRNGFVKPAATIDHMTSMATVQRAARRVFASLPIVIYLCAYIATTVLGAAVLLMGFPEQQQ